MPEPTFNDEHATGEPLSDGAGRQDLTTPPGSDPSPTRLDGALRPRHLIERLGVDQYQRWQNGQHVPSEAYFSHHPDLLPDSEDAFELIYGEFLLREASGEPATAEEFSWRFPAHSDRLIRQIAVHRQMDSLETLDEVPLQTEDPTQVSRKPRNPFPALQIPGYEVIEELGRGGMGVVYRARQLRLDREVALKMVRSDGAHDPEMIARLLSEARAVARLKHPYLVQIFGVGDHQGRPFIEMEYLEGGSLRRLLDSRPWPARDAARLVEKLATAISEAHRQGIVHRDLKPANVLFAADGTAKIADFGLAKLLNTDSDLTRSEQLLGSPSYMAPEQTAGSGMPLDERADIYSLGAILYELLTGRPPFQGTTVLQTLEQVRQAEPAHPSRIQPGLNRDMDTICLKCLEKDPTRRYQSARTLADDLRRFIDGRAILARRTRALERALRWSRREPRIAMLLTALLLSLVSGLAGVSWKWREAAEAHRKALVVGDESRRVSSLLALEKGLDLAETGDSAKGLLWMLEALRVAPSADVRQNQMIRRNLTAWSRLVHRPERILRHPSIVEAVAVSPDGMRLASGGDDSAVRIWNARSGELENVPWKTKANVRSLAFSPDGTRVAAGQDGGTVEIFNAASGRSELKFATGLKNVGGLVFDPDGRSLWARDADHAGGTCRRFETSGGKVLPLPGRLPDPKCLPVALEDGTVLVLVGRTDEQKKKTYQVWNCRKRQWEGLPLKPPDGHEPLGIAPGGRILAFVSRDGQWLGDCWVQFWSRDTGQPLAPAVWLLDSVKSWAFSPDGLVFASSGTDRETHFWDVATGRPLGSPLVHEDHVLGLAFSPDGRKILSGSWDNTARLWDLGVFSPLSGEIPGMNQRTRRERTRTLTRAPFCRALFAPGGETVLTRAGANWSIDPFTLPPSKEYGLCRLVDVKTTLPRGTTLGPRNRYVGAIAFHPDGTMVATCTFHGEKGSAAVNLWDTRTGEQIGDPMPVPGDAYPWETTSLLFSPDGKKLAVGHSALGVEVFEIPGGKLVASLKQSSVVFSMSFHPDGRLLAVGTRAGDGQKGSVRLWDLGRKRPVGPSIPHNASVWRVLFSPDGRTLLSDSGSSSRLWDVPALTPIGPPMPSGFGPGALGGSVFLPDSSSVLLGREGGVARLWDSRTGKPVSAPMKNPRPIVSLNVDPRGLMAAVAMDDGSLRLWDLATASPIGPPLSASSAILSVAFSSNAETVMAATADGSVRAWPIPSPAEGSVDELQARLVSLTGCFMDTAHSVSYREINPNETGFQGRRLRSPRLWPLSDAQWHDQAARKAEAQGMPEGALWHLNRLIPSREDLGSFHLRRARALSHEGQLTLAEQAYRQAALQFSPKVMAEFREHERLNCLGAGQQALAFWHLRNRATPKP